MRRTSPNPRRTFAVSLSIALLASLHMTSSQPMRAAAAEPSTKDSYDVVVYGGTAGGVAAAVQVRRMGKTVVLIEPSKHLGGLTSGGLGATDIGNKGAIGGISREFYRRVKQYYAEAKAWKFEKPEDYRSGRASEASKEDAMWTFEPSVAERILDDMAREAGVVVVKSERLDLKRGVVKQGVSVQSIRMESGRTFAGRRFIDATYEGDLLKLAGVSYHVGREANSVYDETLNGVQVRNAVKHQMVDGVDPYVKKGEPASGLLPGVVTGPLGEDGSGDDKVQAYNFRMCVTDVPENRVPFEKPEGYDELRYELLFRNFEAGEARTPWSLFLMPNRKTDVNNNFGFSTDNIGKNYGWPDGDYETRQRIFDEHLLYQRGLMWTLANHPRVPEKIRAEISRWGNCKDEFTEHGGWSHQIYVREARRMIGEYVMTQHNCQGRVVAEDSVGLAAYTMDSHNIQRYVDAKGHARNEGDVQVGGFPPYPIAYRSIIPKAAQCDNLLAPVALSASHIAYGSIRMEPVFMVLGQSAATAACQSLDAGLSIQKIDIPKLQQRLIEDGQVLKWIAPAPKGVEPKSLPGVVVDDADAKATGEWSTGVTVPGFIGRGYAHDGNELKGAKSLRFTIAVPKAEKKAEKYELRLAYSPHQNRATNVPVTVEHAGGATKIKVDQRQPPPIDRRFVSLGVFTIAADQPLVVVVSNEATDGYVTADAVQALPQP
ncbi:MAG TPA: FAD-dependent oxidoreductase [Pirellulaceae bacterium]|nr:FAD-dependent oxidoreductase [Pirellulaceae bacterium]